MKLRLTAKAGWAVIAVGFLVVLSTRILLKRPPDSIQHMREAALEMDLRAMREAIANYTRDRKQAPQSLQDLVAGQYLREIPVDPITRKADWVPHFRNTVINPEQSGTGIDDVHSNSDRIDSNGKPYNTW
jgi:general secretion pathway protein G